MVTNRWRVISDETFSWAAGDQTDVANWDRLQSWRMSRKKVACGRAAGPEIGGETREIQRRPIERSWDRFEVNKLGRWVADRPFLSLAGDEQKVVEETVYLPNGPKFRLNPHSGVEEKVEWRNFEVPKSIRS